MPVDWRPDTPLKAFIKHSQTQQKHFPSRNRAKKYKRRVFNIKEPAIQTSFPIQESKTRSNPSSERTSYDTKGVLEVQRMLLQKLAAQENVVKGLSSHWSKEYLNGREMNSKYELQSPTSTSTANLERFKEDTVLAVQATWNRSSKK
ncbi:hypothetical protein K469DRAFT_550699 [Zopfia rhizophila CBS 207.26]|uniref:Uncharacterized protein n=1 Tax=Zopfia rhizophila CBS 207.26 TaxID=1314779 RepID=A0A6A6EPV7_9PEZI|nr:hypothetical protein K469DRAFT_550699 [Zopfia rhizophila CBS 207.26]